MAKKTVKEIKEDQGYVKKGPTCSNCVSFTSEITMIKNAYSPVARPEEKNKKCTFGNFVTGKTNWCTKHVWNK